jgi:hypothetical protein
MPRLYPYIRLTGNQDKAAHRVYTVQVAGMAWFLLSIKARGEKRC